MQISKNSARILAPIVRAMATAGTLPQSEARAVILILNESSKTQEPLSKNSHKNTMLTTAEVAKRLGVCSKTVLVMRKNGLLHGKKLTGSHKSLRFPESEVTQLLTLGGANHEK